jgi:hypothetical protein
MYLSFYVDNIEIKVRSKDGYIFANDILEENKLYFGDYLKSISELSVKLLEKENNKKFTDLIEIIDDYNIWIHPDIASRLASWVSEDYYIRYFNSYIKFKINRNYIVEFNENKQKEELDCCLWLNWVNYIPNLLPVSIVIYILMYIISKYK